MAVDLATPRTRRAVIAGALAGLAAWTASIWDRLPAAHAANDENVVLGQDNTETKATRILTSGSGDHANAFEAWNAAETVGGGLCAGGAGVMAESDGSDGPALWARNPVSTAVLGWSQVEGVEMGISIPAKTGVYGRAAHDRHAVGVRGESKAGAGVLGQATTGAAGRFEATSGLALHADGRIRIDRASGVAAIAAGDRSITVRPGLDVTADSFVLLTPRADLGARRLWYTVDRANNTFTIRVSSAVADRLPVGWLLLG